LQRLDAFCLRRLLAGALATAGLLIFAGSAAALAPGDPDPTFGGDGVVSYALGSGPSASSRFDAVALQSDGKIVLAGRATDSNGDDAFLVVRLNSDGSLDSSFGDGGKIEAQLGSGDFASSAAHAVAIQPDGKIVVGGEARSTPSNGFMVARLNPNGSFDSEFGDGGKLFADMPSDGADYPIVSAVAVQGGKIVVGGTAVSARAPIRPMRFWSHG